MQGSIRVRWIAAAMVVLVAAAAAWWWSQQRGADAPTAGVDPAAAFEVAECKPRLMDDQPALAVVFTQPLDRTQSLGEYLRVVDLGPLSGQQEATSEQGVDARQAPKGSAGASAPEGKIVQGHWTIGDNPRIAYFPYIQPQRNFRIEVQAGLLSVDGVKLADGKRCELASDAMAPSWYFASRGVVLPAGQNGGLPIVTVNQPEVDVQFLRVEPGDLPRFFERVAGGRPSSDEEDEEYHGYSENSSFKGRVGGWELDQLRSSTRSVYLGRFKTDDTPNRRHVTFLPVETIKELQEPGVYVAVMAQPGRFSNDYQVTYFYVSDIGVHARRYAKGLSAFATSLKTGKGLSGVEYELLDENARSLGKAEADGDGHAAFADVPAAARLLVARQGREMTVIVLREPGLDLSEFDVGGHLSSNTKLFVYAGRDLYRPGERFDVSVLARNADGRALAPMPLQATLKRPDGRTVQTLSWRPDTQRPGYYQRNLALPADAQTGTWSLELRADPGGAADARWKFQVEEFLPERMKLELRTDKPVLMAGDAFQVDVQGDYLFGSPAAGNRLLVSAATERATHALPKQWPGFVFGDFADDSRKSREEVEDGSLDEQGQAQVTLPVNADGAASPITVRGSFSLLESGGRPVVRSIERIVWPADKLLALRPLFDRDVTREGGQAEFELVRVDTQGRLAPVQGVKLNLVREERQYYWRFDDQKGWHSGYTETDEPVESRTVDVAERTRIGAPVNWGRYRLEAEDPQTGLKLRYRFYAGWNAQDAEDIGNRPDRVQLKLADAPLKAGDKARIMITPPHDGTALVTVEGDRLLWSQRIDVSTKGVTIEVPVDAQWARHDLYATVTVFRPGSEGNRVTPARAVGLVHLPLARDDRKLQVALTAPAKVLPEKRTVVKVKAQGLQGQGAFVTVSAVDVGILNITRYRTPDPVDFFFGKHRYAPELLDMYGKLIEKMEGRQGKLAFGGDSGMRGDTQSLPKKVKLVDLFSGPVALNAQGEAEVALDIPDFNGTLRLMAVVASPERFGSTEAEMVAAAPVVAELAMPRFISPGDAATIALDVTNLSGAPQDLKVKLEGADPVRIREGERTVSLKHQQRTTLRFAAEATDAYGLGRLRLQVTSASGLKIVRESVLQVQPPVPQERDVRRVKLDPGQSLKLEPAWVEKYFKGSAAVNLTVSNKPPLNINRLVQGLLEYPYGCVEQTTSAAYPHVFIDEAAAKAYGLKGGSRDERAQFIEGAIGRLAGMQRSNGGYTLWGDGAYEAWISAYVMGFLQDARAQGFTVPDGIYKNGQDWLLQQLQQAPNRFPGLPASATPDKAGNIDSREYTLLRDSHQRFAEMAHAGYVLARDQKAPLAMLRFLHDKMRDRARSPLPLVHLSIALKLMGDEARSKVALEEAMKRPYGIRANLGNPGYGWGDEWLGDYGSPARDLAMSYALLVRHDIRHARRENLLFDLATRLGGRQYYSTQERLSLFLAARAAGGSEGSEWTAVLRTGEAAQAVSSRSTEMRSFGAAALAQGVTLTSQHGEALFVEVEASGYPAQPPAPRSDVIELRREWFELDGRPWSHRPLKVGDMLIVRLQARARYPLEDGLIVDRIPAGFEVENLNLSQGPKAEEFVVGGVNVAQAMADPRIKHREYRDDRYVAAARLEPQLLNVFYLVRVVSPGRYVVPAPFAEDMYRPELRAVGAAPNPVAITDPRGGGVPELESAPAGAAAAPAATASGPVPAAAPAASAASAPQ
ncbi:alpha-2-macroglobulin family protein [Schlegelella sp. S2-27]|uniref:Alpha-2-macroglobulin family protein n=1 Tax=Caldimonas mangrovi TaxID=2944811 RepID=A0ABT0YMK0_9BURK|nr:alpha-2-macroglobulin [Caldimonas mangrovi]MCM5679957.1 alpha-2-macroglobulin family protein [Caldimonas mangrovi]